MQRGGDKAISGTAESARIGVNSVFHKGNPSKAKRGFKVRKVSCKCQSKCGNMRFPGCGCRNPSQKLPSRNQLFSSGSECPERIEERGAEYMDGWQLKRADSCDPETRKSSWG
jgi:hypothetical protein